MFLLCKCKSSRSCVSLFIVNAYLQSIFLSTLTSIYIKAVIKAIKYCVTLPYKSRFRRKSRKYTVQEIIINRFIEKLLFPNVNLVLFSCVVFICVEQLCVACVRKREKKWEIILFCHSLCKYCLALLYFLRIFTFYFVTTSNLLSDLLYNLNNFFFFYWIASLL